MPLCLILKFIYLYMCAPACLYVHYVCAEECVISFRPGVAGGCELPHMGAENHQTGSSVRAASPFVT